MSKPGALPKPPRRPPAYRAEHFPAGGPLPWLDAPDAAAALAARTDLNAGQREQCAQWHQHGYVILPGLVEHEWIDRAWQAYERAIAAGRIRLDPEKADEADPYPGRCLNPHRRAAALCPLMKHPALREWLTLLIGRPPKVLQTILSHKGSQQAAHSDSIHMTTYPLGYLTAAWIALEDIHPDSGPLVYWPGSHRLPYLFAHQAGISQEDFRREGYGPYRDRYEPRIREQVEAMEPRYFHARKGDVLIWHANLVHGGSARRDLARSRRALVVHYFAEGCFVYHDLASSRSKQQYLGTCLLRDRDGRSRF